MKKRILVADDSRTFRGFVRDTLERAGHEVHESTDGAEALEALGAQHFDLLVLDVIMPETEGIEVLLQVRRGQMNIPVLVVSGGGRMDPGTFLGMADKFGADRVLAKPFSPGELLEAVQDLLGRADAPAA